MHATAHAVIIDRHYIGPLNSLYSFHSRSKTIVELIVAVEILEVFEENDPQEVKISKNTCLEGTSLAQTASFEPSCVRIGCVVWAVDLRKKKKYIHIYT